MKSSPDLVLGIDPGITGALAVYNFKTEKLENVIDMPLFKNKAKVKSKTKTKNEIDIYGLALSLDSFRSRIRGAVIEHVGASPRDGVVGAFSFGFSTGLITGVVAGCLIDLRKIRPAVWKTLLNLSVDKEESRKLAIATFPEMAHEFERKKDHGRAEAALLAKLGARLFKDGERFL